MFTDLDLLIIRPIKSKDLPDLEWNGEFTHFRRMFSDAYQNQKEGNSVLWAAELPGVGLIGQAFVQLISSRIELANGQSRAYIYSVRVKTAYRNMGIGKKIMDYAENDLRQRGFSYTTLNVGKDNPNARRFYERLGYKAIADEPGIWSYLDHQGKKRYVNEPAWRMQKKLR
jgi:ribosomal protein S18 acetylase RimI-like enzyme